MGKLIEMLYHAGVGLTNATLAVVYTFMVGTIAVKITFFLVQLAFVFLSIIRMKDPRNNKPKRTYFKQMAGVGILCIGIQLMTGYNAIPVAIIQYCMMKYWASEGVVLWDIVRQEWREDWKRKKIRA